MRKLTLTVVFYATSLLGILVLGMSMGWLLVFFGILILPVIIVHFIAGARALRRTPVQTPLLLMSSLNFFLASLLRPDGDDYSSYTGLSALLHHLGLFERPYFEPWGALLYITMVMYVLQLILDILLLRKPKAVNELV